MRVYVAGLAAVFVVAGGVGSLFIRSEAERITTRAARRDAAAAASAASQLVVVGTETVWKGLYKAASREDAMRAAANPDFCVAAFVQLAAFPSGHFDVLRPDGSVACSSLGGRAGHPATGYAGEPWLAAAAVEPVVRSYVLDRATGRAAAFISMPLVDGIAAVFLELDRVGPQLGSDFAGPWDIELLITTGDGRTILGRSHGDARWIGRGVAGTPFAAIAREETLDGRDVEGVRRLYARADVPALGWRIYAGVDRADAVADASDAARRGLRTVVVAIFLVLVAALVVERRIARPIVELGRSVRAVTPGEEIREVPRRGPAEVITLADEFRAMASAVRRELGERRQAERQARESERAYRMLFENNPLPMWVFDTGTHRVLEANGAAVEAYGYSRDELLALTVDDLRPATAPAPFLSEGDGGATLLRSGPWTMRRKDGTTIEVEITSYILDYGDRRARFVMTEDVTERARLQRKLNQSQRLESLGQLAGGVAHDFNNLLAVIINYTSFVTEEVRRAAAETGRSYADVEADLKQITRAAERATELTHQLLAFARRDVAQPEVLHLGAVVGDVEHFLRRALGERVELVTHGERDLWPVLADAGQIEQVLVNLAVNARDAMPEGGTLTIDLANVEIDDDYAAGLPADVVSGRYVRLRASDTGVGMEADVVQRAFEPFFTTKPAGEGTGLGLATVYGIVTQAGGHAQIYSEPGLGTTFTALFPATVDDVPLRQPAPVTPRRPAGGETVLVVEDEPAIREVARRILDRNGYAVLTASCGEEALDVAARHAQPIDLLVTDVVMPGKLGKEVAEELAVVCPRVRVLYMSGYAQPVLAKKGTLDAGVVLVEKPFSEEQFLAKVREALDGSA